MAGKAKSKTISVKLMSMALTGFHFVVTRPRKSRPLSFLRYDPVVKQKVLFLEQKRKGRSL